MTLKTSRRNTEEYSQRELSGVGTARYRMTEKRKGDWATEGYEVALLCHVSAAGMHMWRLRSKEHQFTVNQTPRGCIGMKKKKKGFWRRGLQVSRGKPIFSLLAQGTTRQVGHMPSAKKM